MPASVFSVILLCLLMSSGYTMKILSVSQHGPRVLIDQIPYCITWTSIAPLHCLKLPVKERDQYCPNNSWSKSYGVPIKLTCEDRQTIRISVSSMSLFKWKTTVEANRMFPGIHAQSKMECQQTFNHVSNIQGAECELSLLGRKIPSDLMIVTVYECVTTSDLGERLVHTRVAETGDVLLTCKFGKTIDIIDIKLNKTDLNKKFRDATKRRCAMKMIHSSFAFGNHNPGPDKAVACTVLRQGRSGRLMVKYQCLQVPLRASSQQKLATLRQQVSRSNSLLRFSQKRKQNLK